MACHQQWPGRQHARVVRARSLPLGRLASRSACVQVGPGMASPEHPGSGTGSRGMQPDGRRLAKRARARTWPGHLCRRAPVALAKRAMARGAHAAAPSRGAPLIDRFHGSKRSTAPAPVDGRHPVVPARHDPDSSLPGFAVSTGQLGSLKPHPTGALPELLDGALKLASLDVRMGPQPRTRQPLPRQGGWRTPSRPQRRPKAGAGASTKFAEAPVAYLLTKPAARQCRCVLRPATVSKRTIGVNRPQGELSQILTRPPSFLLGPAAHLS